MIADDLGDQLGVGGMLQVLRRLQSGPFTLAQSVTMEQLEATAQGTDPGDTGPISDGRLISR